MVNRSLIFLLKITYVINQKCDYKIFIKLSTYICSNDFKHVIFHIMHYSVRRESLTNVFSKLTRRHWTIITIIIILILSYFVLPIAIPLVVALLTALILNPIVRLLQQKTKFNRKLSVTIVFLLFILVIGFTSTVFVTKAIAQVVNFAEDLPSHFNQLNRIYASWIHDFQNYVQTLPSEFVKQVSDGIEENLTALTTMIKETITIDNIAQIVSKIPQFLISFLVYLIALFLFMLEMPLLKAKVYNLLTEETAEKVSFMNSRLTDVFLGFLKAQFFLSLIIFTISLLGLLIIAPEVAIIMSLIIWIIDLVPIIGSIIVLGPWALYMYISGDTIMGIKLTILAAILLAVRRIVEPKMMGQHMGLSPLATLIAMFLGLKLIGVLGFVLGPVLVIAFTSAKDAGIIKWEFKI